MKKQKTKFTELVIIFAVILFLCSSCGKNIENSPTSSGNIQSSEIFTEAPNESVVIGTIGDVSSSVSSESTSSQPVSSADTNLNSLDNTKRGWGPGICRNGNRSSAAVSYNNKYGKYNAVFIGEDTKNIYLTFDEGYENGYTAPILDTLKEKDVCAVFFVTYDYVKRNPELVKRMIDEGHIVGNHSYSHPSFPSLSVEKARDEILKLHDYVLDNFNYEMKLFRFPMGESSDRMLALVNSLNYKSVFWSFAYADWTTTAQPEKSYALNHIVDSAHNGCIYLLHAVSKTNTEVLGEAIDKIRANGYVFTKFE